MDGRFIYKHSFAVRKPKNVNVCKGIGEGVIDIRKQFTRHGCCGSVHCAGGYFSVVGVLLLYM